MFCQTDEVEFMYINFKNQSPGNYLNNKDQTEVLPKTILAVDDDRSILEALQAVLEMDGFNVVIDGGRKIEDKIEKHNPDLIIMDIALGEKNGSLICNSLKNNPSTSKIPIILISAHVNAAEAAKRNHADNFIAKPFEIDDLLEKVGDLIKN